jgi:hypothetical protein
MNKKLRLNIYSIRLEFELSNEELEKRLRKDFSYFVTEDLSLKPQITIIPQLIKSPIERIPEITSTSQSSNSITYDQGHVRYNDYYGEALSIFNQQTESVEIFSENIERLHEVSYLVALSLSGKKLDLKGLHKVHGMSIIVNNVCCLITLPSKGGKSTLLKELIKNPSVKILSDDTPLINHEGRLLPFPLRLGFESFPDDLEISNKDENYYTLDRKQFGTKHLICIDGLENKIGKEFKELIYINGVRKNSKDSTISHLSKGSALKALMGHLVIGLGLPMVLEYFWVSGLDDFFLRAKIAISRIYSSIILCITAHCFKIELGADSEKNAKDILNLMNKYED